MTYITVVPSQSAHLTVLLAARLVVGVRKQQHVADVVRVHHEEEHHRLEGGADGGAEDEGEAKQHR